MKKLIIKGFIESYYYDNYPKILIVSTKNGYKKDLGARLIELGYNSVNQQVQVNYHILDKPVSYTELQELHILSITGGINVEYDKYEHVYSSWTSETNYVTTMKIGGHNLYDELKNSKGKWIYMEINYNPLK